jgi:hypothetical protein
MPKYQQNVALGTLPNEQDVLRATSATAPPFGERREARTKDHDLHDASR